MKIYGDSVTVWVFLFFFPAHGMVFFNFVFLLKIGNFFFFPLLPFHCGGFGGVFHSGN